MMNEMKCKAVVGAIRSLVRDAEGFDEVISHEEIQGKTADLLLDVLMFGSEMERALAASCLAPLFQCTHDEMAYDCCEKRGVLDHLIPMLLQRYVYIETSRKHYQHVIRLILIFSSLPHIHIYTQ